MAMLILVRHVEHVVQKEVLLGRTHDAPFTERGKEQLALLAESLRHQHVTAIHSSPRRRALDTAAAIAAAHEMTVEIRQELDELNYGEWSGRRLHDLARDPQWRRWNKRRSAWRPPNGESMRDVQARMLRYASEIGGAGPGETIVAVTHAEPIRALLLYVAGIPIDDFMRIDVDPGGVTRMKLVSDAGQPKFRLEAIPA
jgi:broad specificity phosphatase PhoE